MQRRKRIIIVALASAAIFLAQVQIHANIFEPIPLQPVKIIKIGKASWYSKESPGINKYTANNEIFDDMALTAAMWEVPFNQMVRVTNLDNGKSVIVRINDRGPHKRLVARGRIIDLSKQAFASIAPLQQGLIPIKLELL